MTTEMGGYPFSFSDFDLKNEHNWIISKPFQDSEKKSIKDKEDMKMEGKSPILPVTDKPNPALSKRGMEMGGKPPIPPSLDFSLAIVTITGSCHRDGFDQEIFNKILIHARQTIRTHFGFQEKNVILVSSGASWCDQVAVRLFLDGGFKNLLLFLPEELTCASDGTFSFRDSGESDLYKNIGRLLNMHHANFSKTTGIDSLKNLKTAYEKKAILNWKHKGFHNARRQIVQCDFLITYSPSKSNVPLQGCFAHDVWTICNAPKIHQSLHLL